MVTKEDISDLKLNGKKRNLKKSDFTFEKVFFI